MAIINYTSVIPTFMHQHTKTPKHQNIFSIKRSNKKMSNSSKIFIKRRKRKRKISFEKKTNKSEKSAMLLIHKKHEIEKQIEEIEKSRDDSSRISKAIKKNKMILKTPLL